MFSALLNRGGLNSSTVRLVSSWYNSQMWCSIWTCHTTLFCLPNHERMIDSSAVLCVSSMPWCHSQQSLHANVIKPVKSYCTLHYKQISFYLTEYILVHNLVHGAVSLVFDTDSKLNTFTDKKLFYYHVFPACCKYKSSQMWSTIVGLTRPLF